MKGEVVGSAALSDDEVQKIRTFVDRHASEHAAFAQFGMAELMRSAPEMYCILPHAAPFCEDDGRYVRMRFSCVGFVLEAYRMARISLLRLDDLPLVEMADIAAAYPQTRLIRCGAISANALGLDGNGPWPVLLCGYVFHSLNRDRDVIRQVEYEPTASDRHFIDKSKSGT